MNKKIDALVEKYRHSPHVLRALEHHIENVLPNVLTSVSERHERKETLKCESELFMCEFMARHRVYYCAHSELFFAYNGIHFSPIREDEIHHDILANITPSSTLHPWRYRTKVSTISAIKRRSPLSVIPESETIQHVLKLFYPSVFPNRNHAKYFLTVIGDALLDDTPEERIYLASPILKELVRRIGDHMSEAFGVHGALHEVKFKYHGHEHANIRLLFIDEIRKRIESPSPLNMYAMDIMCVAAHYSKRYGGADSFLTQTSDETLSNHALFMSNHRIEDLVDEFIVNSIQTCQNASILSKHMLFLWKKYLQELNVPNVVFHDPLLSLFKARLKYDVTTDSFTHITSPLLPMVACFLEFWGSQMLDENDEENELETGEVLLLFRRWSRRTTIEESFLVELIRHFYPDTVIEESKYILGVRCALWNKRQEVMDSLEVFRVVGQSGASLYDAYEQYSQSLKGRIGVSKRYYEKVAQECLGDQVTQYGIIASEWFM